MIVAFALTTTFAFAQTGTLKGVITDIMTGEAIPFANVVAEKNGNKIGGTTTDFDEIILLNLLNQVIIRLKQLLLDMEL